MRPVCFSVDPFQVALYRGSLDDLEARFAHFFAGLTYPTRIVARTRRFSFAERRQLLRRQTLLLDDVREILPALEDAIRQEPPHDLAAQVALRHDALRAVTGHLLDAPVVHNALDHLVAGTADRQDCQVMLHAGRRVLWPWRWLKNHQRLYDMLEQHTPPLTIDHFFIGWVDHYTSVETIAQVLKSTFLLAGVHQTPLPALFAGEYDVEADYLAPTQPGQPYMTVLTAWDISGESDLTSLSTLLMSNYELAIAIDIQTMPRAQAERRTTDALTVLKEAVHGKFAVADARTQRAYESAQAALPYLKTQTLHNVSYAILLQAPTLAALKQQVQALRDTLGLRLQFERVPGAQAEYLKFFTTQPASAINVPIVRRNTLSHGVGLVPWGLRKTSRQDGTLWGHDPHENMPIHYNVWGNKHAENAHLMMVGRSGSGKTVTLLTMNERQAAQGDQIIYFDPVGKCKWLCEAVGPGATYYNVETDAAINILDPLSAEMGRQTSHVARKLSIVLGQSEKQGEQVRFATARDLNFEYGALDMALQDDTMYGQAGRRLVEIHERGPHASPRLEHLVKALRNVARRTKGNASIADAATTLADEIEARLLGSREHIFNAPTTFRWDFSSHVAAYDFTGADGDLLPLYYDHGFEALNHWIRNPVRRRRQQGLVATFDEFKLMARVPALEMHVAMATKTWRNYQAAMWTADQNATTYFGHAGTPTTWGPFISNNTLIKVFMRQEGTEADMIGNAYRDQLAPEHVRQIKLSDTGEAIVMFDDEVHKLVVQLTDQEELYFAR